MRATYTFIIEKIYTFEYALCVPNPSSVSVIDYIPIVTETAVLYSIIPHMWVLHIPYISLCTAVYIPSVLMPKILQMITAVAAIQDYRV